MNTIVAAKNSINLDHYEIYCKIFHQIFFFTNCQYFTVTNAKEICESHMLSYLRSVPVNVYLPESILSFPLPQLYVISMNSIHSNKQWKPYAKFLSNLILWILLSNTFHQMLNYYVLLNAFEHWNQFNRMEYSIYAIRFWFLEHVLCLIIRMHTNIF